MYPLKIPQRAKCPEAYGQILNTDRDTVMQILNVLYNHLKAIKLVAENTYGRYIS